MARPPGTLRVGRYFLALGILLALLYTIVFLPGNRHTPKLGIDLVGGVRVIFTARGNTTTSQMDQARQIMEDRVNSNGVTGSTVQVQGNNQILILIPNGTGQDVKNLGAAAKLNFRGLVAPAVPVTCGKFAPVIAPSSSSSATATPTTGTSGSSSVSPSTSATTSGATSKPSGSSTAPSSGSSSKAAAAAKHSPADASGTPLDAPTTSLLPATKSSAAAATAPASSAAASTAAASSAAATSAAASSAVATSAAASSGTSSTAAVAPSKCAPGNSVDTLAKTLSIPTTDTAFAALKTADQTKIGQALTNYNCDQAQEEPDLIDKYYVVCGTDVNPQLPKQHYAFLLGPVVVPGTQIDSVNAALNGTSGDYTVNLTLKNKGSSSWAKYTAAHNIGTSATASTGSVGTCSATTTPCADFVAFTLNGSVISSPVNQSAINGGTTEISGSFTQDSSNALAQQLKFGSLPLTFRLDANQDVSATLGSSQLKAALLAGGIGLLLVVVYSLLYYRALGLVTIASLLVSAALVYALLVILGKQIGFTLDLAGVTGFIVALGITADSFVVFFERLKDEVHEGRTVRTAVPRAWVRARRTILSADTVSFLAAAILYFFASADVKGFAFTLGLSTILDLIVVFLFTHPIVSLLSRSSAFGSARFTGLNAVRTGGLVLDAPTRAGSAAKRSVAIRGRRPSAGGTSSTAVGTEVLDADAPAMDADAAQLDEGADSASLQTGPDSEQRRRTTPAAGTAAERAAARRAKLRGDDAGGPAGGPAGTDEDGER